MLLWLEMVYLPASGFRVHTPWARPSPWHPHSTLCLYGFGGSRGLLRVESHGVCSLVTADFT